MSPLMSDYQNPQDQFLRFYNQRVADTGGRTNMADAQRDFSFQMGVQSLAPKDRIPLQYRMQQDQMDAARMGMVDAQAVDNEQWNRWRELQMLKAQQAAAQARSQPKPEDPYNVAADIGRAYDIPHPLMAIQEMDANPDFTKDYVYNFKDSANLPQTRKLTPQAYQKLRSLNAMVNPGIYDQYRAHAGFSPDMKDVSPAQIAAATAARPASGLTPEEAKRLADYQTRSRAELPQYTALDYGHPN